MTDTQPPTPDLDTIQTREQAATPGPWYPQTDYGNDFIATQIGGYEHGIGWLNFGAGSQARADREFVTAARTDVPALLDRIRHLEARAASLEAERDGWAENSRNEERIWTTRVAELEQQLAAATTQVPQHLRFAIAEDLMDLHDDPATPEKYRAGLRYASRRIPHAQDGGY